MSAPDELYFDYAATAPLDPRVAAAMIACLTDPALQGNPSAAGHRAGRRARAAIEDARADVAAAIGAAPAEIVFTSGATEADNLALIGAARMNAHRGRHLIAARTEHKAVLDPLKALAREGFEVTLVAPQTNGVVAIESVIDAMRPDTVLVSLMHVNNEIGVVQDVAGLARACAERAILYHVDAAQSIGRVPLDVNDVPAALVSLSAHKAHGPKGAGALYVRARPPVGLEPLLRGGGQERGFRSGTLATHQIVGMGTAYAIASRELAADRAHSCALRERLLAGLLAIGGVELNGDAGHTVPGIVNVTVQGVEGESLRLALDGLAVSSGAACGSVSDAGSYVLKALGRDEQAAESSLRFSFGRYTTPAEVDAALAIAARGIARLRALTPA
jgi:cysteine desulfurase